MPALQIQPGCFGKWPIAADFVSLHAGQPEAVTFERWLQDGVVLAHTRFGGSADRLLGGFPPTRFSFWKVSTEAALWGSLVPSRDASGRLFPLAVYAQLRLATAAVAPVPAVLDGLLERVSAVARAPHADLGALTAAVRGLSIQAGGPPPIPAGVILGGTTVRDLSLAVQDTRNPVVRAAGNLLEIAFRAPAPAVQLPSYGLRFRLPQDGAAWLPALVFWLELCRLVFRNPARSPFLLFTDPGAGTRGYLDLYYEPPGPLAFLHLLDPSFDSDYLYPVEAEEAPRTGRIPPVVLERLAHLTDPGLSLGDALAALREPPV